MSNSASNVLLNLLRNKIHHSGKNGFEGLIAELLEVLTKRHFHLAKAGSQEGRDLSSRYPHSNTIAVECKRYGKNTKLDERELLSELDQVRKSFPDLDLWVLAASRNIDSQLYENLGQKAKEEGLDFEGIADGDGEPSSLAVLCGNSPETVIKFLKSKILPKEEISLRTELNEISKHPDFNSKKESLKARFLSPLVGYENWRLEQNKSFLNSLKSIEESYKFFHQLINVEDENIGFIERQTLTAELDKWYLNWGQNKQIFTILGEEGDGKTWGIAHWLGRKIREDNSFPAVIFISSLQARIHDPLILVSECISRIIPRLTGENISKRVNRWLTKETGNTPIILLVLDGINERHHFQWWGKLLDILVASPWQNNVAVVTTCRQQYWSLNHSCLYSSKTKTHQLPPYNEDELQKALKLNSLTRSEISDDLFPLICKPRYFDLVIRYREKIVNSGDITIARLIYEDWKDRLKRKRNIPLNDNDFQGLIKNLAAKTLEKKTKKLNTQEIKENIENKEDILEELRTGGIIREKRGKVEIDEKFLTYGFGLLLVEILEKATEQENNNLEEEIYKWLEPHAEMDIKGKICHYATLIALEDIEIPEQVKVALLLAWVNSHNPQESIDENLIAYLPLAPEAYIELTENIWHSRKDNPWAQELLMYAFLNWRKNEKVLERLTPKLEEWLGLININGLYNQRFSNKDTEEPRQIISDRIGKELNLGTFDFNGYSFKIIDDDGLMRLGRVALALISYLPKKQFIRAISIGILAEAIMDYPDKYKLVQWIFQTASDSLWEQTKIEAEKLIKLDHLVTKEAAYRLLSSEGSVQAYKLRQNLPLEDLFQSSSWLEEQKKDPCTSFIQWNQNTCEKCLERTDLSPSWIAERLKTFCLNRELKIPDNLGKRLESLVEEIEINSLWSSYWANTADNTFKQYEPALCAYAPDAIADLVRDTIKTIISRIETQIILSLLSMWNLKFHFYRLMCYFSSKLGYSWRQLSFHIWEHYLILNEKEKRAINNSWQIFNIFNFEGELEKLAESHLFKIVLEELDPEEQLNYLLERPETALDLTSFEDTFKPITKLDKVLSKLEETLTRKSLERILWFLSSHKENLEENQIEKYIYPLLISSKETFIRALVLKIIYQSNNKQIINKFVDSSWQWNCDYHDLENHVGSLLLCQYGISLSYENLKKRLHPAYLGLAIRYRDFSNDEVQQYTKDLDIVLDGIENSFPELPTDFPFIEIRISNNNDFKSLHQINLSDLYLIRSNTFVNPSSVWGGLTQNGFQGLLKINEKDNISKEQSNIFETILQEQLKTGNYYFCHPISEDIIEKIIVQSPNLVEKWLNLLLLNPKKITNKFLNLATTFYETFCSVLLKQNHPQAIQLYQYLHQAKGKVILLHSQINIRFLDYTFFQIEPNDAIQQNWQERLEETYSDLELMELVIAAQNGKAESWLQFYVEKGLESSAPLDFCYAVTILGFLDNNWAFENLDHLAQNQPDTWRKDLVNLSLERWQKNSWAKYWFTNFITETEPVLAWRSFRLFLQCVDKRFWLWQKNIFDSNLSQKVKEDFFEYNRQTIKNSIIKNEKLLEEYFLGQKIQQRQVFPFLKPIISNQED